MKEPKVETVTIAIAKADYEDLAALLEGLQAEADREETCKPLLHALLGELRRVLQLPPAPPT